MSQTEPEEFEDSGVYCCDCEKFYWYDKITLKTSRYICPEGHNVGGNKNV